MNGTTLGKYYDFMPLMNIIVKMMKFYQDLSKLSANLVGQKFIKSTYTFIAEVC